MLHLGTAEIYTWKIGTTQSCSEGHTCLSLKRNRLFHWQKSQGPTHNTTILYIHHSLGIHNEEIRTPQAFHNQQTNRFWTYSAHEDSWVWQGHVWRERREYTNKTYLQIFVIVAVSSSNHTSNSSLPVFSDSGCYCTSSPIKPKCPPPQAPLSLTNSTQKTTIALEDSMSHLGNYKSSKKNTDDKTVWKGLHFKFSLMATITF